MSRVNHSTITGACANLRYNKEDAFTANPSNLDWFIICAGADDGTDAKELCLPNFGVFDHEAADNNGGLWDFCKGGTSGTTEPCGQMTSKDHCEMLDAMVWSETKYDPAVSVGVPPWSRLNCQWDKTANNNQGACIPEQGISDGVGGCEGVADTAAPLTFVEARDLCTAQDTQDDEFDCVVASRLSAPEAKKQLCKSIAKGLNICEADHLQYGDTGDRCRANSLGKNVPGYPRCTWDEIIGTAKKYPEPGLVSDDNTHPPFRIDIPRPCFSSPCDQVEMPADTGTYESFAEYMAACNPNAGISVPGDYSLDGFGTCLPRITDHNFATPLENDAYCSLRPAACELFGSKETCHYASLTVFAEKDKTGATITNIYPTCEWDTDCKSVLLTTRPDDSCAAAGKEEILSGNPLPTIQSDDEYATWCSQQGDWCIPRGNVAYFTANEAKKANAPTVQPFCTPVDPEDLAMEDHLTAFCSMPTFQEQGICTAVGTVLATWGPLSCDWNSNACRAVAVTPPSDNCVNSMIDPATVYNTYMEHVHHCETVKVPSGVCLPAEDVYNYETGDWKSDVGSQCSNYTETTLDCTRFDSVDSCLYVDQNVFSVKDDTGKDIFFGRRCSWDDTTGCAPSLDSCSAFDAEALSSYQELVNKCGEYSQDPTATTAPEQEVLKCVPELQKWDQVNKKRNTCQFQPVLDCKSYIAQTRENCTNDVLFPPKTCQWNHDENGSGSCSDYVATTCETKPFTTAPTDYDDYYNTCSQLSGPGYVCLPFYEEITNEDGQKEPVYRCENYQPTKVACSSFETMAEQSCSKADGLVIPFEEDNGASNNLAFVCGWSANGAGSCVDASAVKDECTKQPLNITSSLYDQADGCRKRSIDSQLCWPLIDNSTNILSNYCYLGRKDGAEVTCESGLFDGEEECIAAKNQWSTDGNDDLEPDSLFPNLTYCDYLSAPTVQTDGCYYNLPPDETSCGKKVFDEVPASFEEYFDICLGAQSNEEGKECVPALSKLDDDVTAGSVTCEPKFGPMSCDQFNNDGDADAARCLAADEHLFERIDDQVYGLSCVPVTPEGEKSIDCTARDNTCTNHRYVPTVTDDTEPDTPSVWKAYNDDCMEQINEDPVNTPLEVYCVAQMPELQEDSDYNTCTNVTEQNLDCALPQFQSKDACDTMKELDIPKFDSNETFRLNCEWDDTAGECKSGMAKLLVPALMVLVSLLL